jgi:hypothetical protein
LACGLDHRLQVGGVERLDADLRGDDDLLGGDSGLGVVTLHPAARGLEVARVRVGHVQLASRLLGQRVALDVRAGAGHPPRAVARDPARVPGRVLFDNAALQPPVLFEPPLAFSQPLRAAARNGLCLGGALGLERLLCLAQPLAPIAAGAQPLGQLVTARLAIELVLGRVRSGGLGEDLRGDLLVIARRVMRRGRRDLGAVDGDNPDLHKPRPGA